MKNNFLISPEFNHDVYISVAHCEEFYKMRKNDKLKKNTESIEKKKDLLRLMSKKGVIADICLTKSVGIRYTSFDNALRIVSKYDTTEKVKENSLIFFDESKEISKHIRELNPNSMNYTNLSEKDIWDQTEVKYFLNFANEYLQNTIIPRYTKLEYSLNFLNPDFDEVRKFELQVSEIPSNIDLKNSFNGILKDKYWAIEPIMEYLFNVLNMCGYNRDKNEKTAESSNYDTQHAINATYCDILVTNDKHFLNKVKAVYYYLGVPTKVMNLEEYKSKYGLN